MQRSIATLSFTLLLLLGGIPLFAQQSISEYTLKAAYTQRFTKFIDWPASSKLKDTVTIAILGKGDSFKEFQKFFHNRKIKDLPVKVVSFKSISAYKDCDILFIEGNINVKVKSILEQTERDKKATLVIGNLDNMAEKGAMFSFFLKDKKLRFKINTDTATKAGFKISTFLLEPATIVTKSK